jgi:hypothetical protein
MHERTVHAATAVDLHATHVAVALRHRRDPGEFRLGCLPSLGRSCWLTASLALFEVILARAGPQARNNATRHPAVKAALENPSVETARGLAKAIRMLADETASPIEALERLLPTAGALDAVWPKTMYEGSCPQCGNSFNAGAPMESPLLLVPGATPADLATIRQAITKSPGIFACLARVPDPTAAIPPGQDVPVGEVFEESDAGEEAEDDSDDDEGPTQPCGFRAPFPRTIGDVILLETPAGVAGKWSRPRAGS